VVGCTDFTSPYAPDRGLGGLFAGGSSVSISTVDSGGGAHDSLRPALDLILSISTLRNGSGSNGSITLESSERLGLCGLGGLDGVNVT
jgi:hypothetical protein